jgi:uncharacterized protein (TIGR00661 family)
MKKNIGFLICGIGKGHLSQAETIYNILLKKNYNIPIVISISNTTFIEWNDIFKDSDYINEYINFTEENMSNFNLKSKIKFLQLIMKPINIEKYVKKYNLDLMISFWTPSLVNKLSIPFLSIANQYSVNNFGLNLLNKMNKKNQIPISVGAPNNYSEYWIPSLIDKNMISKKENKYCVAYSSTGMKFIKILKKIAKNNPNIKIKLFCDYIHRNYFPKNVTVFKICKNKFRKYLEYASCALTTAGDTLVQECVYYKIPVAIIPCSKSHVEQKFNFIKYVKDLKYAEKMTSKLNLRELSKKDMSKFSKKLKKSMRNREGKVLNIIEKFL